MAQGDIQGRARTSPSRPQAKGVCDRCGEWYLLSALEKQMEYFGPSLQWTGFLVCRDKCLDVPQPQNIPLILPPDPVPVKNPRPEYFLSDYGLQGFTQYQPFLPAYAQQSEADVLAALAALSGVATPAPYLTYSNILRTANVSQGLFPADAGRTWMAIYNPNATQIAVAFGDSTTWDAAANLILGPGQAIQMATNLSTAAMSVIGLIPNVPYMAWEASSIMSFNRRTVTAADSPSTIGPTDAVIYADVTDGPVVIVAPRSMGAPTYTQTVIVYLTGTPAPGNDVTIKDDLGVAIFAMVAEGATVAIVTSDGTTVEAGKVG